MEHSYVRAMYMNDQVAEGEVINADVTAAGRIEVRRITIQEPDPYTITIQNLHVVVTSLARKPAHQQMRRAFINKNPIPGAIFDEAFIHTQEIMPFDFNTYCREKFQSDVLKMRSLLAVTTYNADIVGHVAFNGVGDPMCLHSTKVHPFDQVFRVEDGIHGVTSPQTTYRYSYVPLLKVASLRTVVALMTEVPVHDFRQDVDEEWAVRQYAMSCDSKVGSCIDLALGVSPVNSHL